MAIRLKRKPKYTFGGIGFSSQAAVRQHGAALRQRYSLFLTIDDPADVAFLISLLDGHVERAAKIGVGIKRFYCAPAPDHPNATCFFLERHDGTTTDFGVPACLAGIRAINLQSMRMAVKPHIDRFREEQLAGAPAFRSAYSNQEFRSAECVVDHVDPFDDFVTNFCLTRGIDLDADLLTRSVDCCSDAVWRDEALRDAFVEEHRKCRLRLVHARENNSDIARENNLRARQSAVE